MHLGWMVRIPNPDREKGYDVYEARARPRGVGSYHVVLAPGLWTKDAGMEEIYVGTIMKWHGKSWTICGDFLSNYHGVKGMHSGMYAAFHLLQEKGYIPWDRSC